MAKPQRRSICAPHLGQCKKKTLLIDIDPQGNATSGLGVNKRTVKSSTYNLMIGEAKAEEILIHTQYENVDILPSTIELAGAEIELVDANEQGIHAQKRI